VTLGLFENQSKPKVLKDRGNCNCNNGQCHWTWLEFSCANNYKVLAIVDESCLCHSTFTLYYSWIIMLRSAELSNSLLVYRSELIPVDLRAG